MTRAVLLDIPRARGVDYLDTGYRVGPEDLDAAEELSGVRVGTGDTILIRTGRDVDRQARGLHAPRQTGCTGLSARVMPWVHRREVSVMCTDVAQEGFPSHYPAMTTPCHTVGIVAMGLWLLDNAYLEDVATAAVERQSADFLFCASPLKLKRGTGSAINPIVVS